jgi:hypothetical protein
MNSGLIPVTAQWALWGKEAHDAGYRLLECSDGAVRGEAFVEVLTRYSPGTLDRLPQVTVSWLPDPAQRNYVAIAVHDTENGRYDAGGRPIVFTRYFCVPHEEVAAGAVSYYAMYQEFGRYRLGVNGPAVIRAELPASPAMAGPAAGAPPGGLAIRIAALLLTGQPVCVLGADRAGLDTRLRFLDEVMSLLPYGMRSRMSASTWASSTFQEHKLRLFFSAAPRRAGDHMVTWGEPGSGRIGHRYADDYLSWLLDGVPDPVALLAGVSEPMGFGQVEIAMMLERLHVSYTEPGIPAPAIPAPGIGAPAIPAPAPAVARVKAAHPAGPATPDAAAGGPDPAQDMSVPDILVSCARRLLGGNPNFLQSDLERLAAFAAGPVSADDRARYQEIITCHRLFRADLRIRKPLQQELYRLLLQVAFRRPLDYADYRAVHTCAGQSDNRPLHRALLQAINPARQPDPRVQLLGLSALGERYLRLTLREKQLPPGLLIEAAASRELTLPHARIVCDIAVSDLAQRSRTVDRRALWDALVQHGYLAPVLAELYPDQPDYQTEQLYSLLCVTFGAKLEPQAVREVLGNPVSAPTMPLFAAVLSMVDPGDAPLAERAYTRAIIAKGHFAGRVREQLLALLPPSDHFGAEPGQPSRRFVTWRQGRGPGH